MAEGRAKFLACSFLVSAWACGSADASDSTVPFPDPPPGGPTTTTSPPGGGVDGGAAFTPVGLWTVHGIDARGIYDGTASIEPTTTGYRFVRTVHWPGVTVEDGRDLHWVFAGEMAPSLAMTASLRRADYVVKRGTSVRSAADGPIALTGTVVVDAAAGHLGVKITGTGIATDETWSDHRALDGKPLWKDERVFVPGHPPPSAAEKAQADALYADYRKLPVIAPYASRPEFLAAIHGNIVDPSDFDFYRANPNALRVAQKPIDDISRLETLRRANAYRMKLADKAAAFQNDMETRWMDPAVGVVVYGAVTASGAIVDDGDSALWTGTYVAAQAYRYQATGDATALPPLLTALGGLLTLQEITGDWAHFARALRKGTTGAAGAWHQGTGAWANLQWLEGGNNDMVKGLFYGYLTAWSLLCTTGASTYPSYCQRIVTNAKHLVDDVKLASGDTSQADATNKLPASWLYAVVTPSAVEKVQYQAEAEGVWAVAKPIIQATPVYYHQGVVDWSGQHLSMVGDAIEMLLAQRLNLGGDAVNVVRAHIDASHDDLKLQRFATWHFLEGAFGTTAGASSPGVDDARWRLREMPYPKISIDIDKRIGPEFCMSPNPGVPWKQDWMQYPDPDRTEGLATYPLFETTTDETMWKVGADYRDSSGVEVTGVDYLHLYWFARRYGLLSASD